MKKFIYILSIVAVFGFISCEKEEIDPGMAPNNGLAGTWSISEYDLNMANPYGPYHLYTYNTSMDENYIWVDNIFESGIKVKAQVLSTASFGITDAEIENATYPTITISEAEILQDSLKFRVTLYAPDGSVAQDYYQAGHRTTGVGDDTH